jgi:hypothetical protein
MATYEVNQIWDGYQDVGWRWLTKSNASAEFKVGLLLIIGIRMDNPIQFTVLCLELPWLFHQGVLLEKSVRKT